MFRIRKEQLDVLLQVPLRDFDARARRFLQRTFPTQVEPLTDEEFRRFIRQTIDRAGVYGLRSEQAVIAFAVLRLLLGDKFEADRRWTSLVILLADRRHPDAVRAKWAVDEAQQARARGE